VPQGSGWRAPSRVSITPRRGLPSVDFAVLAPQYSKVQHNMTSKDTGLYGLQKQRRLAGDKAISSSTTLSFASQLSSLIDKSGTTNAKSTARQSRTKKDDIFATHNRNTAKRAKRDLEAPSSAVEQKHTTNGETLDRGVWERSKRKMEEKARLYAAMKRGDVEDHDERYAVDFDRKWVEHGGDEAEDVDTDDDDDDAEDGSGASVEYVDEFGRTRTGTAAEAARADRLRRRQEAPDDGDRFTARPSAPANVIYGDTIQHQAFDPDVPIAMQMEELAKKRDKSLTPPPEQHFDSSWEVRTKGTAFMQFSGDAEERQRQMEDLARERAETERVRKEREEAVKDRVEHAEEGKREIEVPRGKRKADEFLDQLAEELNGKMAGSDGSEHGGIGSGSHRVEGADRNERREEEG
jgi:hypothetical protein